MTDRIAGTHGNHELLISYVYDECGPHEREQVEAHLAECAVCAAEIEALGGTRRELAAWAPPDVALGFQIARPQPAVHSAAVLRPAQWWRRPMPAWAQVAAAAVIFGAGLSLGGGIDFSGRIDPAAGRNRDLSAEARSPKVGATQAVAAAGPTTSGVSTAADSAAARELVAEVGRLREELAELRQARSVAAAPARGVDQDALIERVRALIEESEQRQQRELALRTAAIVRDFDSQRSVDLAQIQRSFGQMEGATSAEVREQRQLLNYLMRVSQGQ
jgi:hypothetical protein